MTGFLRCFALLSIGFAPPLLSSQAVDSSLSLQLENDAHSVRLHLPAKRIISLAPHLTEIVYALGAGDRLVGVTAYSDYPPAARQIARVGNAHAVDFERIVDLKPDLILAWESGNGAQQIAKLRRLALPVLSLEIGGLDEVAQAMAMLAPLFDPGIYQAAFRPSQECLGVGIARSVETLGSFVVEGDVKLTGTDRSDSMCDAASVPIMKVSDVPQAEAFLAAVNSLRARYAKQAAVPTFIQIWHRPLTTVGGRQFITDVVEGCGGSNVFSELAALAPAVSWEGVIDRNPHAILIVGDDATTRQLAHEWHRWPGVKAVKDDHVYFLKADWLTRAGPRLVLSMKQVCAALAGVRSQSAPAMPTRAD